MGEQENEARLTRRASLLKLGGIAAIVAGGSALVGRELLAADDAEASNTGLAAVDAGLVSCV
jgi:hypothetical protein